ncbi:MAG: DUF2442 domain-containing protein [Bacteroidetes bacterium]|nr:DUF2442 domain-containing protein [Bacteroidota bacterium]
MIVKRSIQVVSFSSNALILKIDGKIITISLDMLSPRLMATGDMQRNFYKVSPSGYGIHWPLIDEDLSVEAILKYN